MYKTTIELQEAVNNLYSKLKPLTSKEHVYRPIDECFGKKMTNGTDGAFCYTDKKGYHYCVVERGKLIKHLNTTDINEIIYQILRSDIIDMASSYESRHRIDGQDSRRLMFAKVLEYWELIGEDHYNFAKHKIQEILTIAPFVD